MKPTTLQNYLPPDEQNPNKRLSQPGADAIIKMAIFTKKTTDMILTGKDYSNLLEEERNLIDLWRDKDYKSIRRLILDTEEQQETKAQSSGIINRNKLAQVGPTLN